uniref:Uncharacterized protein n=1 Tax=Anopheles albimanus TaxID=7167 RepID=A0A182FB71_ANOAL
MPPLLVHDAPIVQPTVLPCQHRGRYGIAWYWPRMRQHRHKDRHRGRNDGRDKQTKIFQYILRLIRTFTCQLDRSRGEHEPEQKPLQQQQQRHSVLNPIPSVGKSSKGQQDAKEARPKQ